MLRFFATRFAGLRTGAHSRVHALLATGVAVYAGLLIANAPLGAQSTSQREAPLTAQPNSQPAQMRREVLQGHVTNTAGASLAGAVVIATMAPDRVTFSDTTNAGGTFSIPVANGTGDYLVYVSSVGLVPARKRVTRTGNDSVFVVNLQLAAPAVAQLATVQVAAKRATPQRAGTTNIEAGASERISEAMNGALSVDQLGDLNAIAMTTPGAIATAGGYSVLGLGATQNSATLNGLAFNGAALPRDSRTTARVSTSTYDAARGWFSGSNVNMELAGGGLFGYARGHATLDAPVLQLSSPVASAAGQRFTNARVSYGADGPLTWENKHFYNVGVQADRRTSDLVSLATSSIPLLQQLGVSPDFSARSFAAIDAAGAPLKAVTTPTARIQENASFVARLERTPSDPKTFAAVPTTYGVLVFGQAGRDRATGVNAFSTDTRAGETNAMSGGVQATLSHYFGKDYLNETRSSFTMNSRRESSLLAAPEGRAFVQATFDSSAGGNATLAFGGNSSGNRNIRQYTWETVNTTKFYAQAREAHAIKLTTDLRFDRFHNEVTNNPFGTFTYASLADVASNSPSSFSRTLTSPARTGGEWNAFAAIGDNWKVSRRLQFIYGLRFEGNMFAAHPAFNQEVATAFGVRTDYAPNSVHVSPRLGFTWWLAAPTTAYKSGVSGDYVATTPRFLRGGIGEFRSMTSAMLLSDATAATGLSNASAGLSCVGAATPVPEWQNYDANPSSIPSQCAGNVANVFADAAPTVRLVESGYRPPTSWRANLVYGTRTGRIDWSAEVVASLNLHQTGQTDLNFAGTQKFLLADEGRPVFVEPSAIVESSGIASPVNARVSPMFGRVVSTGSDLQSFSQQFTLSVRPVPTIMQNWYLAGWYTLANTRAQLRGFDGAAFGSPAAREWARGDYDVRHQILTQFGYSKSGVTLSGLLRVQSGLPFTPTVAGDVNGDGVANDRAFVANPAVTHDAKLANDMQALLSASRGAANCLASQLGRAALRNSCENPWSAVLNAELRFDHRRLREYRISSIAVNLSNPLAGIDQLLHGSNGIHGWGSPSMADATLFTVRGFDAATQRFAYAVNPRFGSPGAITAYTRTPFRLTLDISMNLGQPVARQQLNKWLRPGRAGKPGAKLSRDDLKKRYENNVPDPFKLLLQDTDSLLLNRTQVEALQAAERPYRTKMDSVWSKLAVELSAIPDDFDDAAVLRVQERTIDHAWEITRLAVHQQVAPVLTPVQLNLVTGWIRVLYRTQTPSSYRLYVPQ